MRKRKFVGYIIIYEPYKSGMSLNRRWGKNSPNWLVVGRDATVFPTRRSAQHSMRMHATYRGQYVWSAGHSEGYDTVLRQMRIQGLSPL